MTLTVKRRVTLDLARRGAQVTIPFSRGDRVAYEIIFTITDGIEPVSLPPGTVAAVAVKNGANGSGVVDSCVVDHVNGTLKYIPSADALSVAGNVSVTLTLADDNGAVIGAPALIFCIADDGGIETETEVEEALQASPGWPIIAQTESNAKSAAQSKDDALMYAQQAREHSEAAAKAVETTNENITVCAQHVESSGENAAESYKYKERSEEILTEVTRLEGDAQYWQVESKRWAVGDRDAGTPSNDNSAAGYAEASGAAAEMSRRYSELSEKYSTLRFNIVADAATYTYTLEIYREGQIEPLASAALDLPLEETVIDGSYDENAKTINLTLKNGNEISIPIGNVVNDNAFVHRQNYTDGEAAAYVENQNGTSGLIPINVYSNSGTANSLVRRGRDGAIYARGNPEHSEEAVSKEYADSIQRVLKERLDKEVDPKLYEMSQSSGLRRDVVMSQRAVHDAIGFVPGKNLFNKNDPDIIRDAAINTKGEIDQSAYSKDYYVSGYIPVIAGETYALTKCPAVSSCAAFYDKNKIQLSYVSMLSINTAGYKVTIPDNACYMRITDRMSYLDAQQVELGSRQTVYEPYEETPLPAENSKEIASCKARLENADELINGLVERVLALEELVKNLPSTPGGVTAEVVGTTLKLTGATVRGTTLVLPKGSATVTDGVLKFK